MVTFSTKRFLNVLQHSLANNGVDDFVILEYQDRIGGRMHDVEFGEGPDGKPYTVEAGANWVQGTVNGDGPENPIHTLVSHLHLLSWTI